MVPWAHPSPQPKRHPDQIGAVIFAGQTTDHATRSVTTGHIYVRSTAMQPKK